MFRIKILNVKFSGYRSATLLNRDSGICAFVKTKNQSSTGWIFSSTFSQIFFKIVVFKNFVLSTRKTLGWESLFNKVAGPNYWIVMLIHLCLIVLNLEIIPPKTIWNSIIAFFDPLIRKCVTHAICRKAMGACLEYKKNLIDVFCEKSVLKNFANLLEPLV